MNTTEITRTALDVARARSTSATASLRPSGFRR